MWWKLTGALQLHSSPPSLMFRIGESRIGRFKMLAGGEIVDLPVRLARTSGDHAVPPRAALTLIRISASLSSGRM